jgi:hypothetical protein
MIPQKDQDTASTTAQDVRIIEFCDRSEMISKANRRKRLSEREKEIVDV